MTSMFSATRNNHVFKNEFNNKEIQAKKERLAALESVLKEKINELKEVCLKEAELTGHLPIDYPLQPREPIPQVRRRVVSHSNGDKINHRQVTSSIAPPCQIRSRHQKMDTMHYQAPVAISAQVPLPRPTSTNSTSSSLSTASSNNRLTSNHLGTHNINPTRSFPTSYSHPSSLGTNQDNFVSNFDEQNHKTQHDYAHALRYDPSNLPNHFRKTFVRMQPNTFIQEHDGVGQIRASSTTSSASSSGSAASSTLSAPVASQFKVPYSTDSIMHARSCSETIGIESSTNPRQHLKISSDIQARGTALRLNPKQPLSTSSLGCPPPRPPRGLNHASNNHVSAESVNGLVKRQLSENRNSSSNDVHKTTVESSAVTPLKMFNVNEVTKFQPYYEETKPFQMSDFYKYSSKHRQRDISPIRQKTTRQLQEDVSKPPRFSICDDQIQASVKLIEKSGQKLFEATAKAIAGNPALAEKLNNILPNNGDRYLVDKE